MTTEGTPKRVKTSRAPAPAIPRIEEINIQNYRALRHLELRSLTPLTVLLGPNGSGKSTVLDVFAFLSECFSTGLRQAVDKRGRFRELRSRGSEGPIVIEIKYRERSVSRPQSPVITYHLAIEEGPRGPFVYEEWLQWRRGANGKPFRFLDFRNGEGQVISGENPDEQDQRINEKLASSDLLAVNTFGQLSSNPRVRALRSFITSWYLSYLTADNARTTPEAGPQDRLSETGDNLPNVIQYLYEQYPERLENILQVLSRRVPQLKSVETDFMADGRLLLQIRDAPFERPILARFASDGTLKMLAYLTVLHDPNPPQLVGIEEPENHLHPRLLPELAEESREASGRTQLMVTTHSPFFVNELRPEELWVLYRDHQGYTKSQRVVDIRGIPENMNTGAKLGHLWMEGAFGVGDPLTASGGPKYPL